MVFPLALIVFPFHLKLYYSDTVTQYTKPRDYASDSISAAHTGQSLKLFNQQKS